MRQIFTINIFLVLAIFHAVPVLGEEGTDCCTSKTVGTYAYTLLEAESAPDILGCQSPCVYQRDGEPGSRYCFKKGDLAVTCKQEDFSAPGGVCTGVYDHNTRSCRVGQNFCNLRYSPDVQETVAEHCTCVCEYTGLGKY